MVCTVAATIPSKSNTATRWVRVPKSPRANPVGLLPTRLPRQSRWLWRASSAVGAPRHSPVAGTRIARTVPRLTVDRTALLSSGDGPIKTN